MNSLSWLPNYKIKPHRLAKHVKLRISRERELHIIIPHRFNTNKIPQILAEHKQWIVNTLAKLEPIPEKELPQSLILQGGAEQWTIIYMPVKKKLKLSVRPNHEIVLIGEVDNIDGCLRVLKRWVKSYFSSYLISELEKTSDDLQLPFLRAYIGEQKTLWGSCNSKNEIRINYKLIFLPHELRQHIFIHELCHTKHHDHSAAFWNLVAQCDPLWKEHKRRLKHVKGFIPHWASA
jgi:predicted metal-dependent hydrolase